MENFIFCAVSIPKFTGSHEFIKLLAHAKISNVETDNLSFYFI